MIVFFKIFEQYVSKKENILNQILDKIQKYGKSELTTDELDFLSKYPNGSMDFLQKDVVKVKDAKTIKKSFEDYGFEFNLKQTKFEDISNTFMIYGILKFPNGKEMDGSFEVNLETQMIHNHFSELNDDIDFDNVVDVDDDDDEFTNAGENVYELDDFLYNIFYEIIEDKKNGLEYD